MSNLARVLPGLGADPRCPHYHLVPKEHNAQLRWRKAIVKWAAESKENQDTLWQMCQEDILFYINTFVLTTDPRKKKRPIYLFNTYPYQDEYILDMVDALGNEDLLIEKSRDMGASWICLIVIEWHFHFYDNLTFLLVSWKEAYVDSQENSDAMMWKLSFLHKHLPIWLRPAGGDFKRKHLQIYNPETGSCIDGTSTTGDIARGGRRTAILLDEFASVLDGYSVLRATMAATDCRIFNSSAKGFANAFFALIATSIKKFRFHWTIHPEKGRDAYFLAKEEEDGQESIRAYSGEERRALGTTRPNRSPWYDRQCKRAVDLREIAQEIDIDYGGSVYQFFNAHKVRISMSQFCRPPEFIGDLELDVPANTILRLKRKDEGPLRLWCPVDLTDKPVVSQRDTFIIGCDISAGTGGPKGSNSVASITNATTGEKIGEYVHPELMPHLFASVVCALGRLFSSRDGESENQLIPAKLIWESNGPGLIFGKVLVATFLCRNIYYRTQEDKLGKKRSDKPGWFSSTDTKLRLLGAYRAALGEGFVNPSKEAHEECLEFVYDGNGVSHSASINPFDPSAAKANHGDRVIADALAWLGIVELKNFGDDEPDWDPEPPQNSVAGRQRAYRDSQREKELLFS